MKCKYCGKEIDEGSIFCGYCGKQQPKVKYCIKCGQEIGLDDVFCGYCGAPQINEPLVAVEEKEEQFLQSKIMEEKEMVEVPSLKERIETIDNPEAKLKATETKEEKQLLSTNANEGYSKETKTHEIHNESDDIEYERPIEEVANEDKRQYESESGYIGKENRIIKIIFAVLIAVAVIIGVFFLSKPNIIASSDEDTCFAADSTEEEMAAAREDKEIALYPIMKDNGKCGFIDKKGKIVISCEWNYVSNFYDGLACVQDDNSKYGFIDKKGKLVIPCEWEYADDFSEGLARVKNDNYKFGFIDKLGKLVIQCVWDGAWNFSDGLVRVWNNNGEGFIDKTGKQANRPKASVSKEYRLLCNNENTIRVNNGSTLDEHEVILFLEEFYRSYDDPMGNDSHGSYIRKHITNKALKILRDEYYYEYGDEGIATWMFDGGGDSMVSSLSCIPYGSNKYLVERKTEYRAYRVLLTIIRDGDTYKIDNIEKKSEPFC